MNDFAFMASWHFSSKRGAVDAHKEEIEGLMGLNLNAQERYEDPQCSRWSVRFNYAPDDAGNEKMQQKAVMYF